MRFVERDTRSIISVPTLLLTIAAACYLIYRPGLDGPLIFDDFAQLVPVIEESGEDPAYLWGKYHQSSSGPLGRPVAMTSFIVDAVAYGPDVRSWKRTNLLLHLATGLLAAWLAYLILTAAGPADRRSPWLASAVLAGIWLLHPLHVSTVLYLVQRMTELSTLFVFAGLICYIGGRLRQTRHGDGGFISIAAGFTVFFPLSVLSKESGLLFPVYCAIAELMFFRFGGTPPVRRAISFSFLGLLMAHVAALAYLLVNFQRMVLNSYQIRDFSIFERLLTQPRAIGLYLSQLLTPSQRNMGFFHDDFPVSTSLTDPPTTALALVLVLAMIGIAIALRKRIPLFSFGVLLFFASHLMESSIFALELVFEHRNYLGAFGLLLAVYGLLEHLVSDRKWLPVAAAVCLLGTGWLTSQRAQTWSTVGDMYLYMYMTHPDSPRLNEISAEMQLAAGNYANARQNLEKLNNNLAIEMQNLVIDCREFGRIADDSVNRVARDRSARVSGTVISAAESIATEVVERECVVPIEPLVRLFDRVIDLRVPTVVDRQTLIISKARILEFAGETDRAVDALGAGQQLRPDDALLLYVSARTLARVGRLDEAASHLLAAAEIEESGLNLYRFLSSDLFRAVGRALLEQDRNEEAVKVFAAAVVLNPDVIDFELSLADALLRLGRNGEAQTVMSRIKSSGHADLVEHRRMLAELEERLRAREAARPSDV